MYFSSLFGQGEKMTKTKRKKRPSPQTYSNHHFCNHSNHIWYIFLNRSIFKYSALMFKYIHLYLSHVLTFERYCYQTHLDPVLRFTPTVVPVPAPTGSWTSLGSPIISLPTFPTLRQSPAPICLGSVTWVP